MSEHLLLWFDLETTGLDPNHDFILEVGWGVSNFGLDWLHEPVSHLVENQTLHRYRNGDVAIAGQAVDEFVVKMHEASGLWDEMLPFNKSKVLSCWEIGHRILDVLTALDADKVSMAGSGVAGFDMRWIQRWMPALHERLTYYSFDMGTFERVHSVLTGGVMRASRGDAVHRAVDDILYSHGLALEYQRTLS